MVALLRRHPLVSFVLLTYALSWAVWIPLILRGELVVPGGSVTHFPGLLGPAAAAFLMIALTEGLPGVCRLLRRMGRVSKPSVQFLCYSLSPLACLVLALVVARLTRQPVPPLRDFGIYSGLPALPMVSVVLLVLLFNGFGEETGWRGFALERLQRQLGPVRGALALGLALLLPRSRVNDDASSVRLAVGRVTGQDSPEAYELNVDPVTGVRIVRNSAAGVFYGVQTLRSLLPSRPSTELSLPALRVVDAPRFAYRGLMLDVARNFQTERDRALRPGPDGSLQAQYAALPSDRR
jgi:membrane protease YdiL (CAAX protease family)